MTGMRRSPALALLVVTLLGGVSRVAAGQEAGPYVGTTMGFVDYLEDVCGVVYREHGVPTDPFASVRAHGGNIARFALHTPPYENRFTAGLPPADWGSFERVKAGMRRAAAHDLELFLTLAYDSYAAEGAQRRNPYAAPPLWQELATDEAALADTLYGYTYRVLDELAGEDLFPSFVAIGNEINWRFLEPNVPEAELAPFDAARKLRLLNAGARAVRDVAEAYARPVRVVMHIFDPKHLKWWMSTHAEGLDFDVLGLSYYPAWHEMGDFDGWGALVAWLGDRYGKQFILLETAQLYTTGWSDDRVNILSPEENIPAGYPNPPTVETQRRFLTDITREIVAGGGLGTIYWGGEHVGTDCYVYPDGYGPGSSWENKTFWDLENDLHAGIDWMSEPYGSPTHVDEVPELPANALVRYPNPAGAELVVEFARARGGRLAVYSVAGRLAAAADVAPGSTRLALPVAHLPPGLYLLELRDAAGRVLGRTPFVRAR